MGGAKKTPAPAKGKEPAKKEAPKKEIQKTSTTSVVDPKIMDQIKREVPRMKFVTPYQVYSKYNIKYSVSKDILESMRQEGSLKVIRGTRRLDIYVPSGAR